MSEEPKKGNYISQAWLVILLALLYGGALAGVQTTLGPIIEQNKRNETYNAIPDLVEGAVAKDTEEVEVVDVKNKKRTVYKAVGEDGELKGWVLAASGQGFADKIDVLVGLSADLTTITGIYVLDQKETPGLGNFIVDPPFRDQFVGKSCLEPVQVVKAGPAEGNQIVALSGATISSESVATIVNEAIERLRGPIEKLAAEGPGEEANTPPEDPANK